MSRLFHFEPCFRTLSDSGFGVQAQILRESTLSALSPELHGSLVAWIEAWYALPDIEAAKMTLETDRVSAHGTVADSQREALVRGLHAFHPWRKGPFDLFNIHIDTEWRSDWKWNRLKDAVDLRECRVLDVGCGNGYFGWRMLAAGAESVIGLDPFVLYVMQNEVVRKYLGADHANYVLPLSDSCLPPELDCFDVTLSMGVLYHRTSPIDHLQTLHRTLQPGGQLILETLIVEESGDTVLMPDRRYAKMRNVWFLPSIGMLQLWLRRTGFRDVTVVDVTATTVNEQRSTDWMTFESLPDFLDATDSSKTVEGYPAPVRAILKARK